MKALKSMQKQITNISTALNHIIEDKNRILMKDQRI